MAIGMPHANPPCYFRDGPPAGGPGACSASYRLATSPVSRCRSTCRDTSVVSASIRWLPVPRRSSSTAELARVALRPTRMRCAPSSDPSLRTGRPDRPQTACEWSYRPWHVGDSRRHPKTPHSSTRALDLMMCRWWTNGTPLLWLTAVVALLTFVGPLGIHFRDIAFPTTRSAWRWTPALACIPLWPRLVSSGARHPAPCA